MRTRKIWLLCAPWESFTRDQAVEFWCADESFRHDMMQAMLQEAGRTRKVYEDNAFQLWTEGATPLVFPWTAKITLDYMRRLIERHMRIPKARQRLAQF